MIDPFAALKVAQIKTSAGWTLHNHTIIAGRIAVPISGIRCDIPKFVFTISRINNLGDADRLMGGFVCPGNFIFRPAVVYIVSCHSYGIRPGSLGKVEFQCGRIDHSSRRYA